MLNRKILFDLENWKKKTKKKSLVVTGPRQCGKTTIIREFGKCHYTCFVEINFKRTPSAKNIFAGDLDVNTLLWKLQFEQPGVKFIPQKTLLFLDEIQECPEAITSLKFWTEDKRFDVICSGSLLDIDYNRPSSYPVGYVEFLKMKSLDFEEYLEAVHVNQEMILQLKEYFDQRKVVPEFIHHQMMQQFRIFSAIGGMPEVVQNYVNTSDFREVHQIQTDLLEGYRYDIAHYANAEMKLKAEKCYFSLSKQLLDKDNHKFQYGVVEKKGTARKYESSVDWLINADIAAKSILVSTIKLFPEDYTDETNFRVYTTDIGMLVGMRDFSFKQGIIENTLRDNSKGGFWEAAIADVLVKKNLQLYFYKNDTNKREIEFVILKDGNVIPIEVKGGKKSVVSLNGFMKEHEDIPFAYKLMDGNIGVSDHRVISLPLYMSMFI